MNDNNDNTGSDARLSPEELAIVNAAFKLYEILIAHRAYKRGRRGKHPFTRGVFTEAKNALAGLLPHPSGLDPIGIVAHFANHPDVAKAAIMAAVERLTNSRQEEWDSIRDIELSDRDLKALSDHSPIFKRYRSVTMLDKAITELNHPNTAAKAAGMVWTLAHRVRQLNRATATVEAAA
ncbi:hypothetical protein IVB14_12950 [Bradyrhizobium sp. 180]|uniref:hypothetical protein n=1 Tax=Bradyrhizobium sp. 180 TaxID=2782650 RepID=UPI001FF74F39|nr:hypothetical protein [Bradyrhizobium sp. 180]MCK1491299.1 hypothetical protein [Bradyrhizobium sp. 180]